MLLDASESLAFGSRSHRPMKYARVACHVSVTSNNSAGRAKRKTTGNMAASSSSRFGVNRTPTNVCCLPNIFHLSFLLHLNCIMNMIVMESMMTMTLGPC